MTVEPRSTNQDSFAELVMIAIREILAASDDVETCQRFMTQLQQIIPFEKLQIYLIDAARKRIALEFDQGRVVGTLETNYKAWNNSYSNTAYRTGQPILVNGDIDPDEGRNTKQDREELNRTMLIANDDPISQMIAPLKIDGKVLGTVVISNRGDKRFRKSDLNVVVTLAYTSAAVFETTRLHQEEIARRRVAEILVQAGRKLTGDFQPDEVPTLILAQLNLVVPYERGSLMLEDNNALRIVAQQGFPSDSRAKQLRISIREGDVYEQVINAGKPVIMDDVTQISGWQQVSWLPINRSWMGTPIFSRNRIIGMISLTRRDAGAFTHDDSLLVSTFALQAAIAIENAHLYERLTRFNQQLEEQVNRRTDELNKALQSLERLDRQKSDFISVAAHELRTPLTVMKGYTSMLEKDPAILERSYLTESLRGVMTGAERLQEIVNSMLDVARIENQTLTPHLDFTNLSSLIKHIAADLGEAFTRRKIRFEMHDLNDLPKIRADATLLLKVFHHLISNAIKYTPNGGLVTVSGRQIHDKVLGDCVQITVKDSGIGIDPDQQELIFNKFYQTGELALHSSGKINFKGGGPGLGLAIARGIVLAHNGRIWVESEGHDEKRCPGSRFHVILPI